MPRAAQACGTFSASSERRCDQTRHLRRCSHMRIAALASLALASLAGHTPPELTCPYVIQGRVTDQNGSPLQQASVSIVGTNQGASSDAKGDYRLQLNCPQA